MKKLFFLLFLFTNLLSASAQFVNNNKQIINVLNFKANGDMRSFADGVINSTTTFTSATASFVAADAGKMIRITGAGSAGADLITTIASVSNSTTVILTSAASASGSAKAFDYGTDNTAALQAAANAVPVKGGVLYLPLGNYLKNGLINIPNPTLITGDMRGGLGGNYDSTSGNTNRPHSKIYEISANLPQSITIQSGGSRWENLDLYLSTGNTLTSGVGLNINGDNVSIYNSIFEFFWTCVSQNYSAYWKAEHSVFAGYQYGLVIRNINTADAGDWAIDDCFFGGISGSHPESSGVLIQSSGGMKFSNCKWNVDLHKCVSVEILGASSNTSDFQMTNNSLENFDSTGINIIVNNSAVFSNVQIIGNQISPFTNHTTGINLNGTGATFFKGIVVDHNVIFNQGTGDTAVKITAAQDVHLDNTIFGGWTKEMYIDATSTDVTVNRQMQTLTLTPGATVTWDISSGTNAQLTMAGAETLVINSMVDGEIATLFIIQDATGGRVLTAPANCFLGGSAMTTFPASTTANAITYFTIKKTGSNYYVANLSASSSTGVTGSATGNQVAVWNSSSSIAGASTFTNPSANTYFLENSLQIGNTVNSTGVVPQINSLDVNLANISDLSIYPSTGTNVGQDLVISPKGTGASGNKSTLYMMESDIKTGGFSNFSVGFMRMTGTAWSFTSTAGGSGTTRPITITAGVNPSIEVNTSASVAGNVLLNNTTDNTTAFLQVTNSAQAQQAWHYDATHDMILTVGSGGIATFAPTGTQVNFTGLIAPTTTATYDLGTSSVLWRDVYIRGIVGVITNSNAQTGSVGEYVSSLVAIGSPVSLSNGIASNITSISLTAGDWDVDGQVSFTETTSTVTARSGGVTSTTGTVPVDGSEGYCGVQSTLTSETNSISLVKKRFSLSTTTTIFLVGKASFSAGTCGGFGVIVGRRVR